MNKNRADNKSSLTTSDMFLDMVTSRIGGLFSDAVLQNRDFSFE